MPRTDQENPHRGHRGGVQGSEHRIVLRMLRAGWLVPDDKLEQVRESIEYIATESPDHRARVQAAALLINTEVAYAQSAIALSANQTTQVTDPTPEPDDPE
jgi:hypothetical protein